MSMILDSSNPPGLEIKTYSHFINPNVCLGDYEIDLEDFLMATEYVLTNTDLEQDDPRLKFVEKIKKLGSIDGYNKGGKKLGFP